jgi:hypothetical protein
VIRKAIEIVKSVNTLIDRAESKESSFGGNTATTVTDAVSTPGRYTGVMYRIAHVVSGRDEYRHDNLLVILIV